MPPSYMPSGEAWVGPDAGDVVSVEGRYTAKHAGNGKSIDAQFCHAWTLNKGKITRFQQYTDTAKFQAVMGVPD